MSKRLVKLAISLLLHGWDAGNEWLGRLVGRPCRPSGVILYYHAIRPELRTRFARQLDAVLASVNPFLADTAVGALEPGRHAAVTFDDGYVSVIENALPELRARGIPFTMFVATGSLGQHPTWIHNPEHPLHDERVMSREQLLALAAEPLATIGSHTVTHANLASLDGDSAARELAESKRELEKMLDRPVYLLSFPHGAHNQTLVDQALELGYRRVFTIEPEQINPADPGIVVGRVAVEPTDWPLEFHLKLLGAYRWQTWRRQR